MSIAAPDRAETPEAPPARRWAAVARFGPGALAAVLMRLRFVFSPITSDEGGYLAIGRAWRHGAVLYRDVWVDRPQGLLVAYRLLDTIGLGTPEGVRLLGIAAALVAVVACGDIAARLAGPRAGWAAALLVGVLSSVPQYEGFTANAELLSGAAGAAALALVLRATWGRTHPDLRGLAVAGVTGGIALSLKQSGFDAFLTGAGAVAVMSVHSAWDRGERRRALPALLGGLAVPVGLLALHGALTGWRRWWFAVAGYRLGARSALVGADWTRLRVTYHHVAPALLPVAIAAVAAALALVRRAHPGASALLGAWTALATVAFLLGGQFFRHYWVILVFPLATAAGTLLAQLPGHVARPVLLAAVLANPAVLTVEALGLDRAQIGPELHDDVRMIKNERVAVWFRAHAGPGDRIYAMCASAGLYAETGTDPPYPYLWYDAVRAVPGAEDRLESMLTGPEAPRFVAVFQDAAVCDPSGRAQAALDHGYRLVATVETVDVLERSGSA